MKKLLIFCLVFCSANMMAQNLLQERIRTLVAQKKSLYFDKGVFHNGVKTNSATLKAIRHSFSNSNGYERIVLDFKEQQLPRVYGNVATKNNKIFIDLFNTNLGSNVDSFGNSKYVESIDLYPITEEALSMEINLKRKFKAEVFYLNSPARLVIDIK